MRRLHGRVKGDRFNPWQPAAGVASESPATDMSRQYTEPVDPLVANAPEMRMPARYRALREGAQDDFPEFATPQDNLVPIIEARGWTRFNTEGIFGYPATKIQTLKNKNTTKVQVCIAHSRGR